MLTRLQSDDKAESRESDEKDEMNRRAGKTASRIPTFNKRPAGSSGAEHHGAPRRDSPEVGGHDSVAKSKLQDGRSLPQPSVYLPKVGLEAPLSLSSASFRSPGSSELAQSSFMSVTPRPSLRGQLEEEKLLETQEAEIKPDVTLPHLPSDSSFNEAGGEEEEEEGRGDFTRPADIRPSTAAAVEAIMDEEPPWSSRRASVLELKDSRSSSDVEREDESPCREGDGDTKMGEVEEKQRNLNEKEVKEPQENPPTSLNGAEQKKTQQTQKESAGALSSTLSAKVSFFFSYYFCLTFSRTQSVVQEGLGRTLSAGSCSIPTCFPEIRKISPTSSCLFLCPCRSSEASAAASSASAASCRRCSS